MRQPIRFFTEALVLVILLGAVTLATRWMSASTAGTRAVADISASATAQPLPAPIPTACPTPSPSPTSTPTDTPTPTTTPTPTATPMPITPQHATPAFVDVTITGTPPPLPVPTPMPLVEQAEGVVNILLLGSDQEHISGGVGRTDVIVVASIYPDGPTVSLLSIPRDLYVWIPSYGFDRINTAYGHGRNYPGGGPALVKATIEYNLGIPIHYYALVDFASFVQIVNTVGGVDVAVECELHDTFPDPANTEQSVAIDLYPGIQHLDGQQALWYVRSRWSTSDFDRNRRQQQVLRGLYRQTLNAGLIPRIPELWDAVQATVQTDLGLSQVVWLGWIGSQLDWSNVKSRFIAPPFITPWTTPNGAAVYLPVPDAIGPLVTEALQPPATGRANQPAFRVEIWDGTGGPGLAEVAAERLRWEGFIVTAINPAGQVYERTRIVDFTTTTKGTPLWLLLRLYNRTAADVTSQPTEGAPFDFQVLLGADYNPCLRPSSIYYVPPPTPTPTPATTPG